MLVNKKLHKLVDIQFIIVIICIIWLCCANQVNAYDIFPGTSYWTGQNILFATSLWDGSSSWMNSYLYNYWLINSSYQTVQKNELQRINAWTMVSDRLWNSYYIHELLLYNYLNYYAYFPFLNVGDLYRVEDLFPYVDPCWEYKKSVYDMDCGSVTVMKMLLCAAQCRCKRDICLENC